MEGEKRKSKGHDAVLGGTPKRAREDDKGEETTMTVTDEEVEEFYAILRRMHVAVNYFKKGNPNNGDECSSLTWMRKAESQNSGRNIGAKGGEKEEENVEENIVGFDLNADPGSDPF